MIRNKTGLFLCVTLLVLVIAVPAGAVVKQLIIAGPQGEPVPNATVSIFAEDGTKVGEAKTDDRGQLAYDFPSKGKYTVRWEGGAMTVPVAAVSTPVVLGTVLGATAIVGGITSGGNSSPEAAAAGGTQAGTYTSTFAITADPSFHDGTLLLASGSPHALVVTVTGSTITITGPVGFQTVTGTLTGNTFTATGFGTAGGAVGAPNADLATMSGTFSGNTWSGTYIYGSGGNLPPGPPGGNPVSYTFTGTK